jgi:hypothetical protein
VLLTNDSISLAGLTLSGGNITAFVQAPPGNASAEYAVAGGGAVAVQWPPTLPSPTASFVDVVFQDNSVWLTVDGSGDDDSHIHQRVGVRQRCLCA